MARSIAFAVVVTLVASTVAVVVFRHLVMRRALESSARHFASLVHVPLVRVAEMYERGIDETIAERVQRLLRLNQDVRNVLIVRTSGSVAFQASREEVRIWPNDGAGPSAEELAFFDRKSSSLPVGERLRSDGQTVYRVVVPSEEPHKPYSMSSIATFSYDRINRQLKRDLLFSLIALVVGLFVTDRVSKALARGITRNLAELQEAVRRFRIGHLDNRVVIQSDDEVEQLALAFNTMADELEQTIGRLREANRELQAVDEIKSDLLANVSHELRTPLTALKGFLELLDEGRLGPLGGRAHRAVTLCRRNVDRLALRVEDLVQLSQVEKAPPDEVIAEPVDMREIVALVAEMYGPRIRAKELDLTVEMPSDLQPVEGTAEHLERVVLNLIDNAVKFTPEGGSIRVSAEECDHEGREGLLLRVVDTGIGIPSGERVRVFDRFHQVDPSIRRRFGGMGLGLSLVHHTVETHGGVVWLDSEEGAGSTFFVWLPTVPSSGGLV